MYAEIRKYKVNDMDALMAKVRAEFVPLISSHAGFIAYYVLDEGPNSIASVSIFDTQAEARESNRLAVDWIKQSISMYVDSGPEITEGHVIESKEMK